MDKRQVLNDFIGGNLPLIYSLAHKLTRRMRERDVDTTNEFASEIIIRSLECSHHWDPSRCSACTFIVWQARAVLSRQARYKAVKFGPHRTAIDPGEAAALENLAAQGDPSQFEQAEFVQRLQRVIGIASSFMPNGQGAAVRATVLRGKSRRQYAQECGVTKSAIDQRVNKGLARLAEFRPFRKLAEAFA